MNIIKVDHINMVEKNSNNKTDRGVLMFIVINEAAGDANISIGVFSTLEKATNAFKKCLIHDDSINIPWTKLKDAANEKEYFYTDGSYGWTVTLREIPENEMWIYS